MSLATQPQIMHQFPLLGLLFSPCPHAERLRTRAERNGPADDGGSGQMAANGCSRRLGRANECRTIFTFGNIVVNDNDDADDDDNRFRSFSAGFMAHSRANTPGPDIHRSLIISEGVSTPAHTCRAWQKPAKIRREHMRSLSYFIYFPFIK